jgi:hypothetical protein
MYARRVTLKLKPNATADFTKRLEKEIIPLLRKQEGFRDEIVFASKEGAETFGISLWDRKENAEAYGRGDYSKVKKLMESLTEGEAHVDGYEVSTSTLHKKS